ncbi:MAG: restriction endonuclease subunit S [Gammaproteobacteria bacterium HGW-Gammaproteobacteria-11]|nr:MAG: restriction endonuclease subunit S [Gammaproteobacteria bacterium HGW-Gammaproteobacteria-11]
MSSDTRRTLRDLVSLQRGTTYKGALVGLPGPVLLGLASIEPNGGFRYGGFKTYGGDCPEKISLKSGDLYVSLKDVTQSGDLLGSIARVPSDIASGRLTQDTVKLVFDGEPVSKDYIYWLLRTSAYREYCRGCATGTTTLGLSRDDFLDFPVPSLTPADEVLIELLEGVEKRITLLRETNATLEAIAQALFKSWFVDFDPVRAKAEGRQPEGMDATTAALFPDSFEESELGLVPKGWKRLAFTETVKVIGGGTPKTSVPEYWDGDIPWFSVVDAPAVTDVYVIDTAKHISLAGLNGSSTKLLPEGTTIISARGTVGRLALVGKDMAMNQSCYGLHGKAGDAYFTYFNTYRLVEALKQRSHGSVFDTITNETMKSVQVTYPRGAIIEAFEAMLRPFMLRIKENLEQAKTLTQLRDTLLPRLISGQLRLLDAESLLEKTL